ncbi:MAG: carboxypeptidase-like regulatory domain-containing protein [Salinisphaera sp.]|nr:carboxypeptidase-like regulatory domain-containing protein [Salinisphaera sp.]
MNISRVIPVSLGLLILAAAPLVGAAQTAKPDWYNVNIQKSDAGFHYVTGGVGDAEQAVMSSRFDTYSYKLVNVVSGPEAAFVSNVHVVIINDKGKKLLETTTDGPWLIANLSPGKYSIKATFDETTKTRDMVLHDGAHERMVIDWNPDGNVDELVKWD